MPRYQEGGLSAVTGVGEPKMKEDEDQPLVPKPGNLISRTLGRIRKMIGFEGGGLVAYADGGRVGFQNGGLAAAVAGTEERPEESLVSSTLRRQQMDQRQAMASLQAGRDALAQQKQEKRDKSARWLAFAQGMLSPTKTGSFGESLGYTAGALGKVTAAESKRELDLAKIEAAVGPTSAQRMWDQLTAGLSDEDLAEAERIKLGLAPRRVGSSALTTMLEGLTDRLAESEAKIDERKEFGKKTGASRAKAIDSGIETIMSINKNVLNLDRAYADLEGGAQTGFIDQYLPSFRESTVRFEQVQKELGLDIIGATQFGALSAGELQLALATGIPPALEPEELMVWLQEKKAAQLKLKDYFMEQIDFLDQGGTIAGWLREKERGLAQTGGGAGPGTGAPTPGVQEGATATNPSTGEKIIFTNGQWVPQ